MTPGEFASPPPPSRRRTVSAWLILLMAAAGVLGAYAIGTLLADRADADPGATPDWIAAVATLAAFGAALVAGWYAHRALVVEQDRDRIRDGQVERAQAELVAAWIDEGPLYGTADAGGAIGDLQVQEVTVLVRNASQLPATNVEVVVYQYSDGRGEPQFIASRSFRLLPPESTTPVIFQGNEIAAIVPPPDPEMGARVMLTFLDAGGRAWIRRRNSTLMRVPLGDIVPEIEE